MAFQATFRPFTLPSRGFHAPNFCPIVLFQDGSGDQVAQPGRAAKDVKYQACPRSRKRRTFLFAWRLAERARQPSANPSLRFKPNREGSTPRRKTGTPDPPCTLPGPIVAYGGADHLARMNPREKGYTGITSRLFSVSPLPRSPSPPRPTDFCHLPDLCQRGTTRPTLAHEERRNFPGTELGEDERQEASLHLHDLYAPLRAVQGR